MKRKILVVELWGLGDLTFASPLISAALEAGDEVHLVGKPHARDLLEPSFPSLKIITYDAPWTAYIGKYRLWKWRWFELLKLVGQLRSENYDVAVSIRNDPRNQLFMWLAGARERVGFIIEGRRSLFDAGRMLLSRRLKRNRLKQHKVEDWRQIGAEIGLPSISEAKPSLHHSSYRTERIGAIFAGMDKPVICLHSGARIPVRRWPERYFARVVEELRNHFDFHLLVIPEPQTLPSLLAGIADTCLTSLTTRELVDVLGRSDLLICNDSGPAHIAACCGRPSIPVFGPSDPDWFRPWGDENMVVIRDICPWRPCFDYCKFSEPYCMTKLLPETVWPDIQHHILELVRRGVLTERILKTSTLTPAAYMI